MAYTTIDDPSAHFQIKLYSGNSTNNTAITNDGNSNLQPDFIWAKSRSNAHYHDLRDSTRGVTKRLASNDTGAESTKDQSYVSFDSDGFTLGDDTDSDGSALNTINTSSNNYVAWQWKANGGTTSSNSSGTNITSTVQANTTAGFSIVTFTGTGNDGDSYGHGLSSAPELVIPKRRDGTTNWQGYAFDGGNSQYWYFNLENAFASTSGNSAASSSSVITTDGSGDSNPSGGTVVSYCFHSVKGYSKIGRYSGTGNADGAFVYTGFKPTWVLIKVTNSANHWIILDSSRTDSSGGNSIDRWFRVNTDAAEVDGSGVDLDFVSNGFKFRSADNMTNNSGKDYFYMAFAEHPFVSSEGVPVTAR